MYDLLVVHYLCGVPLPTDPLRYIRWNGIIHASSTLETMAYDVLTEEEMKWLDEHRSTIMQFASGEFAGHVSIEDRSTYHNLAQRIVKFNFMVCWTCGSSIQHIGNYIKNGLGWH